MTVGSAIPSLPAHWPRERRQAGHRVPRRGLASPPADIDVKPLKPELVDDLARIFGPLYAHRADPNEVDRKLGRPLDEFYAAEPVGSFLTALGADSNG